MGFFLGVFFNNVNNLKIKTVTHFLATLEVTSQVSYCSKIQPTYKKEQEDRITFLALLGEVDSGDQAQADILPS